MLSLWLRLVTIAAIALLFFAVPHLPAMISNWRLYQTPGEIVFGILVRVLFVVLGAVAAGTVCTAISTPFLLGRASSRQRVSWIITGCAVAVAAFFDLSMLATMVATPLIRLARLPWFPTLIVYCLAFAVVMLIPRRRKQIVTSLDSMLGEKTTRRAVITMGAASASLVAAEWAMGKVSAPQIVAAKSAPRTGPNILLISFDALSAEDMSAYGYRLPTTPNIGRFAEKSSVFTNYYSVSTFTTSCVATMLTGVYPTDHHVYHLYGRLGRDYAGRALPNLMRAGGYSTGAAISNPYAYFVAEGLDYSVLPDHPAYRTDGFDLWRFTGPLHQRQSWGSRAREFTDLEIIRDYRPELMAKYEPKLVLRTESGFPPAATFAQAREVLGRLNEGFFMWVHVMAPHSPYLPDAPWKGRFLAPGEMMTMQDQLGPMSYDAPYQGMVDKARLRYDEFVAEADSAFGSFLSDFENSGKLANTAVIVTADHGESFEGGIYGHASENQTRPQVHIPLLLHMPGQKESRQVSITADQTALAPTILDIAGLPRPDWMRSQSLIPWINSENGGAGQGFAFTEYLQRNTIFEPLHNGTVGVIDGRNQYVVDLETGKGILRSLPEAHLRDCDHSAEYPAVAAALRRTVYSRFPDLPRKQA